MNSGRIACGTEAGPLHKTFSTKCFGGGGAGNDVFIEIRNGASCNFKQKLHNMVVPALSAPMAIVVLGAVCSISSGHLEKPMSTNLCPHNLGRQPPPHREGSNVGKRWKRSRKIPQPPPFSAPLNQPLVGLETQTLWTENLWTSGCRLETKH